MSLGPPAAALLLGLAAASCGDGRSAGEGSAGSPPFRGDTVEAPPTELETAAADVIAFLRGAALSDRVRLGDTVVLHISPEGGGARRTLAGEQVLRSSDWVVESAGQRYSLVPPPALPRLTTREGSHFNCMEYPLATRFTELAKLPHVGTKLEPESGTSCLQSWNLTIVFDSVARPPRVVAVVYDQWEW